MRLTLSGDYPIPSKVGCYLGNLVLFLASLVPKALANRLVAKHDFYQVFGGDSVAGKQGGSSRKWQALGLPEDLNGKSLVDIGCSEGFFCLEAAKHGAAQVLGIDVGLGALLCARLLTREQRTTIHYRLAVFPQGMPHKTFDYVLCLSVLHHLVSTKNIWRILTDPQHEADKTNLRRFFACLASLTAPGGCCIVEMPYEYDGPSEREAIDFDLLTQEIRQQGFRSARTLGTWDFPTSKDSRRTALSIPLLDEGRILCSWTNGRKALVLLVEDPRGRKAIVKRYRTRFVATMLREYFVTKHLAQRLQIVPRVLGFQILRRQIVLSYVEGQRLLEWVLQRYGDPGLELQAFQNYGYLETCSIICRAFGRFRQATDPSAVKLKQAIRQSYAALHRSGFVHGSADPRNVIYDGHAVHIIDFDHSRPRLPSEKPDQRGLAQWYGLTEI